MERGIQEKDWRDRSHGSCPTRQNTSPYGSPFGWSLQFLHNCAETLRKGVRQAEPDEGGGGDTTTEKGARMKELEPQIGEPRRANEILNGRSLFPGRRPPTKEMIAFIDKQREDFGI